MNFTRYIENRNICQAAASISVGSISAQQTSNDDDSDNDHYQQESSTTYSTKQRKKQLSYHQLIRYRTKNMKKACQNHNYSKKQFREIPLWTPDLQRLVLKFKIQNFLGVYPADHHPYMDECDSNWIWNTDISKLQNTLNSRPTQNTWRQTCISNNGLFGITASSYKVILNTISGMQHKNVSIEIVLKNHMQSTNTFTCGWWSIYYLISSKFKTCILPYLHSFVIKHFLYNYFKTLFEGKWPKCILDNQYWNAMSSEQNGQQCCTHGKNCIEQCCKYSKP